MYRFKREKFTKLMLAFIFFTTVFLNVPVRAEVKNDENLSIKIEYGYEGKYKMGINLPLNMEVENKGKDLEGELQVKVPNGDGSYNLYSQKVNLPKDSKKKFTMAVPVMSIAPELQVFIVEKDKPLYKTSVKIDNGRLNESNMLVGILSEDFNSLSYFSNAKIKIDPKQGGMEVTPNLVKLTKDNMPENSKALDALDIIVIDNFDTSIFSKEQYEALKEWVEKGKLLVLGTGTNYQKNLSVFKDEFITGDMGRVTKQNLTEVNKFLDIAGESTIAADVMDIKVEKGEVLIKEKDIPVITSISKKNGTVVIAGFALGMEPMASWKYNGDLWTNIYGKTIANKVRANWKGSMNGFDYRLSELLGGVPGSKMPNMKLIAILFAVYVLLVGPLSYFVLKKLNKRDKIWISVPVLAVIFSIIIFFIGGNTRLNAPFTNTVSIGRLDDKGDLYSEVYIGAVSPSKADMNIQEPKDIKLNYMFNPEGYNRYGGPQQSEAKQLGLKVLYEGNKTYFEFKNSNPFEPHIFKYDKKVSNAGKIKCDVSADNGKLVGKITNDSELTFESAYFITPNSVYELGTISKGENKDIFSNAKEYSGLQDFIYGPRMNPRNGNQDIKQRNKLSQIEVFLNSMGLNGNFAGLSGSYLVGFTDKELNEGLKLNGKDVQNYESNLIAVETKIDFVKDGVAEYPYGYIKPMIVNQTGQGGYSDFDERLFGSLDAEFHYKIDENINLEEIKIKTAADNNYSKFEEFKGEYNIYNYKEGKYEKLDVGKDELILSDASKYLKDNIIKINVKTTQNQNGEPSRLPVISIKGRVK